MASLRGFVFDFLKARLPKSVELRILLGCMSSIEKEKIISKPELTFQKYKHPTSESGIWFARVESCTLLNGIAIPVVGSAEDPCFVTAKIKALSEFFERLSLFHPSADPKKNMPELLSSNGCAFHKNKKLALQSAYLEMIERDAFLTHWYTKTSGKSIKAPAKILKYVCDVLGDEFELSLFRLNSLDSAVHTVLALIQRRSYLEDRINMFMGIASGFNEEKCINKSFEEANRFVNNFYLVNRCFKVSEIEIDLNKYKDVQRYLSYQSTQTASEFVFFKNGPKQNQVADIADFSFRYLPLPMLVGRFFSSVVCFSDEVQPLDYLDIPRINSNRLKSARNDWNETLITPHPVP